MLDPSFIELTIKVNALREKGMGAQKACGKVDIPNWRYFATNRTMYAEKHPGAIKPKYGKGGGKRKPKKEPTTRKKPVKLGTIERAIKQEFNAFVNDLDKRIDTAMNEAVKNFTLKYFKG